MEESRELVRQAKKGKREAFAKLYETVYEDMYRFALYVLKDREDAEDAVAETVADAFESIGKLRKEEAFRAWIFQILSNKCKRKLKEYITKTYSYEESEQKVRKRQQNRGYSTRYSRKRCILFSGRRGTLHGGTSGVWRL